MLRSERSTRRAGDARSASPGAPGRCRARPRRATGCASARSRWPAASSSPCCCCWRLGPLEPPGAAHRPARSRSAPSAASWTRSRRRRSGWRWSRPSASVIRVNRAFCELLGRPLQEILAPAGAGGDPCRGPDAAAELFVGPAERPGDAVAGEIRPAHRRRRALDREPRHVPRGRGSAADPGDRHHRPARVRGPARAPGRARLAHRSAQPARVHGASSARTSPRGPSTAAARSCCSTSTTSRPSTTSTVTAWAIGCSRPSRGCCARLRCVEEDAVARLGGDEFAVLLPDRRRRQARAAAATRLLEALDDPARCRRRPPHLGQHRRRDARPERSQGPDDALVAADLRCTTPRTPAATATRSSRRTTASRPPRATASSGSRDPRARSAEDRLRARGAADPLRPQRRVVAPRAAAADARPRRSRDPARRVPRRRRGVRPDRRDRPLGRALGDRDPRPPSRPGPRLPRQPVRPLAGRRGAARPRSAPSSSAPASTRPRSSSRSPRPPP